MGRKPRMPTLWEVPDELWKRPDWTPTTHQSPQVGQESIGGSTGRDNLSPAQRLSMELYTQGLWGRQYNPSLLSTLIRTHDSRRSGLYWWKQLQDPKPNTQSRYYTRQGTFVCRSFPSRADCGPAQILCKSLKVRAEQSLKLRRPGKRGGFSTTAVEIFEASSERA